MTKEKLIKLLAVTLVFWVLGILTGLAVSKIPPRELYYNMADSLDLIEVIDTNKLSLEELNNRNGKLIIERTVGTVTEAKDGSGRILYGDPRYAYINYKQVDGISNGDVICSYFIYNPDTNYEDDVLMRFDYIIEDKNGVADIDKSTLEEIKNR